MKSGCNGRKISSVLIKLKRFRANTACTVKACDDIMFCKLLTFFYMLQELNELTNMQPLPSSYSETPCGEEKVKTREILESQLFPYFLSGYNDFLSLPDVEVCRAVVDKPKHKTRSLAIRP